MAAAVLTAWADSYNCLRVHLSGGGKMDIVLQNDLQVKFSETHLLAEGGTVNVEVPKADIVSFEHRYEPGSGVEGISTETVGMTRQGDMLVFEGLPQGSRVVIFNVGGVAVRHMEASGSARVSLEGLQPGVYIVKANGKSYKITLR